ncbi:MAG: ribose 5-phosphate isomerase B [Clostridia bacterium]|nr:ribose 5-phosphate isomerase B [Clostridia bacterium]
MIAIASDHAGYPLKQVIAAHLREAGIAFRDYGTDSEKSCDYAVFAQRACNAVISGECERAILCCGTGVGISMAANKVRGIRCVCCSDPYSAAMGRRHNDANALAIGARVVGTELGLMIVDSFLGASFEGERHARRVGQIMAIERGESLE